MPTEDRSRPNADDLGDNPYRAPGTAVEHLTGDAPSTGSLSVTYALGAGDVWRLKGFYVGQHPGRLAFLILAYAWVVGSAALYGYLRGRLGGDPLGQAVTFGVGAGVGLGLLIGLRILGSIHVARGTGALSERTVTISPAGIDVKVPGVAESRWYWSSLPTIGATRRAIYIVVNRFQLMTIPRRAFASAVAADEFLSAARRWHVAAVPAGTNRSN